jgi:mRNA interferase RelE/StbE
VYTVEVASKQVEKQLDRVHDDYYPRVAAVIDALTNDPRPVGVKKLSGKVHRIRVGPYRIIYSIHDKEQVVVIDKVARRGEHTYKG